MADYAANNAILEALVHFLENMRCISNLGKLFKNNLSETTRRKQLVENTKRKTRRKFPGGKLVARTENDIRQI